MLVTKWTKETKGRLRRSCSCSCSCSLELELAGSGLIGDMSCREVVGTTTRVGRDLDRPLLIEGIVKSLKALLFLRVLKSFSMTFIIDGNILQIFDSRCLEATATALNNDSALSR